MRRVRLPLRISTMSNPRSEKLQPEYVLASGERLKLMAAQGLAIAKAAWAEPSDPPPPMTALQSGIVKGYLGPQGLELLDLINAMRDE